MKVAAMRLITQKLDITNNNLPAGQFKLHPQLTRKIGRINDTTYFVDLGVTIRNSPDMPFPTDIEAVLRGIFEFAEFVDDTEPQQFMKCEAVDALYPYLRAMVSSLACAAMVPPIIMPLIKARDMFPEDGHELYS